MARIPQKDDPSDIALASDLSTISPQYKVHVPKECLAVTDWSSRPSAPLLLIAELVEFGRVRLHVEADVREKIGSLRDDISQSEDTDSLDRLGALNDRYREITFYTKEKTVLLKPVIVVYLGVTKEGERQVFVEARKASIDIMSLEYRNRRLDILNIGTTIEPPN